MLNGYFMRRAEGINNDEGYAIFFLFAGQGASRVMNTMNVMNTAVFVREGAWC